MTLIEQLQAATEGSQALDVAICAAAERDLIVPVPHYSRSIDDALTLVPEGLGFEVGYWPGDGGWAWVGRGETAGAATAALALCIAALKARMTP